MGKLVVNLEQKLGIFTVSVLGPNDLDVSKSWFTICQLEAECIAFLSQKLKHSFSHRKLKCESYGLDLLHTIGFVYVSKVNHHLATNQTFFGMGGWLHNVQGRYHVFSEM